MEEEKKDVPEESEKMDEASCSKEKDPSTSSGDSNSEKNCVDWLDILQTTTTLLLSALEQKSAREEPT